MSVEFRRASPEDARLLAETRRRAWDTTYRGIYPDAMIDEYDLEAHTARDAARIADPSNAVFLAMDGAECVGYFTYGPYTYGRYKDFALCLNSLYFLPGYRRMGLGRRAFAQLTEFCRERGIQKFFCGCNCLNLPDQTCQSTDWFYWSLRLISIILKAQYLPSIFFFTFDSKLPCICVTNCICKCLCCNFHCEFPNFLLFWKIS